MSFRERIAACNRHDLRGFRPFLIDGNRLGSVRHALADRLRAFPDVFAVRDDAVAMQPWLADQPSRSAAVASVLAHLRADGLVAGWRDELYPVTMSFGMPPLLHIGRAAAALFGVCGYGVHMNGFVRADALLARLRSDEYVPVRVAAAKALAKLGDVRLAALIDEAARKEKEATVVAAARAAARALRGKTN